MVIIWAKHLKAELQYLIADRIKVRYVDNQLVVRIEYNSYSIFTYNILEIDRQICAGLDAQMVANGIAKRYKAYILKKHFKAKIF